MGFVICNSWAGISASLQLALLQGGPVTLVYSIIISTTAYFAIAASLGELASVYPTAGGQYHFASILAPPSIRRGISYACGILGIFSWVAISVSVTILIAETLMAVVAATHEGFVVEAWHIFLVYEALAFLAFIYNVLALKRAPWTHIIGCEPNPALTRMTSLIFMLIEVLISLPYYFHFLDLFCLDPCSVARKATEFICMGHVYQRDRLVRRCLLLEWSFHLMLYVHWPGCRDAHGRGMYRARKNGSPNYASCYRNWLCHWICLRRCSIVWDH